MSAAGIRFEFGRNWRRFASGISEAQVNAAVRGLQDMLGPGLAGLSFLDVGCGSGLSSLAAVRLGARVHAFDYDEESVNVAMTLRDQFGIAADEWSIEHGDVLDEAFVAGLGQWDVVYAWGVLHHTGDMWRALNCVDGLVSDGGRLFVALYNDQGWVSRVWRLVKRTYVASPRWLRFLLVVIAAVPLWGLPLVRDLLRGNSGTWWKAYYEKRGMSPLWDLVDWVGGYPFEVADPDDVISRYEDKAWSVEHVIKVGNRLGCNQFVFCKSRPLSPR